MALSVAARVGFIDNQFVLNPTMAEQKQSRLDLVVAGTDKAVLMVGIRKLTF